MLTDEECETLIDACPACQGIGYVKKYEFCAGKKHEFPASMLSFTRKKKRLNVWKQQRRDAKKYGIRAPGRYRYAINGKMTRVSLGTKESYPYDWFIGGVDSCQGDSGGPIFFNRKVLNKRLFLLSQSKFKSKPKSKFKLNFLDPSYIHSRQSFIFSILIDRILLIRIVTQLNLTF